VNKKAQEQYQFTTYFNEFTYFTWDTKKGTLLLKKIKNNLFPGVKINIEQYQSINKKYFPVKNRLLNPLEFTESKASFLGKKLQGERKLFTAKKVEGRRTSQKKILTGLKRLEN